METDVSHLDQKKNPREGGDSGEEAAAAAFNFTFPSLSDHCSKLQPVIKRACGITGFRVAGTRLGRTRTFKPRLNLPTCHGARFQVQQVDAQG